MLNNVYWDTVHSMYIDRNIPSGNIKSKQGEDIRTGVAKYPFIIIINMSSIFQSVWQPFVTVWGSQYWLITTLPQSCAWVLPLLVNHQAVFINSRPSPFLTLLSLCEPQLAAPLTSVLWCINSIISSSPLKLVVCCHFLISLSVVTFFISSLGIKSASLIAAATYMYFMYIILLSFPSVSRKMLLFAFPPLVINYWHLSLLLSHVHHLFHYLSTMGVVGVLQSLHTSPHWAGTAVWREGGTGSHSCLAICLCSSIWSWLLWKY